MLIFKNGDDARSDYLRLFKIVPSKSKYREIQFLSHISWGEYQGIDLVFQMTGLFRNAGEWSVR